jgi:hypothetical protein
VVRSSNPAFVVVARPMAAQAQRGLGDRLEHGEGDVGTARTAAAVVAGPDPGQRKLDVVERAPGAGLDEGLHLAHRRCRVAGRTPTRGRHRCHAVWFVHVELSELLTTEVALVHQRRSKHGHARGEEIASAWDPRLTTGRHGT